MTLQLHGYQELARDFVRDRGRAGLFLDTEPEADHA